MTPVMPSFLVMTILRAWGSRGSGTTGHHNRPAVLHRDWGRHSTGSTCWSFFCAALNSVCCKLS